MQINPIPSVCVITLHDLSELIRNSAQNTEASLPSIPIVSFNSWTDIDNPAKGEVI